MAEVNETLSVFVARIERLSKQFEKKDIIFSDELEREYLIDKDNPGIEKEPILWPLFDAHMFYIVRVKPGTHTLRHRHIEPIFRLLVSGSVRINGRTVNTPGTWFVVRTGVMYEIETDEGYVTLTPYGQACEGHGGGCDYTHIRKE
jgi:hypothetical protein